MIDNEWLQWKGHKTEFVKDFKIWTPTNPNDGATSNPDQFALQMNSQRPTPYKPHPSQEQRDMAQREMQQLHQYQKQ